MMRRLMTAFLALVSILAFAGCAHLLSDSAGDADGEGNGKGRSAGREGVMTQTRMEIIFGEQVDAIEGPSGAIRTQVDGINVYLISDSSNDRMRIVAPIALIAGLDARVLSVMLDANFSTALDARYASSEGVIYSIYLHPISSLTPELIRSALDQVLSLVKTFGTTYSSGVIEFGRPGAGAR
jgi:hypothetical protein